MATIEQAVAAVLKADGTVAGLVSTRVYYDHAPQGAALPYLVFEEISGGVTGLIPLRGGASLSRTRMQITAWAATATAAAALRAAARAALNGYVGTVEIPDTGSPPDTFDIQAAIPDVEAVIPDDGPSTDRAYGRAVDVIFHHPT